MPPTTRRQGNLHARACSSTNGAKGKKEEGKKIHQRACHSTPPLRGGRRKKKKEAGPAIWRVGRAEQFVRVRGTNCAFLICLARKGKKKAFGAVQNKKKGAEEKGKSPKKFACTGSSGSLLYSRPGKEGGSSQRPRRRSVAQGKRGKGERT